VPHLIDCSRHREFGTKRKLGQRAEQAADLGGGGRVAVDSSVALLECDGRIEGERMLRAKQMTEQPTEDVEGLGVDRPAELGFALDVDGAARAGPERRGGPSVAVMRVGKP
jgi:hypothetical protein